MMLGKHLGRKIGNREWFSICSKNLYPDFEPDWPVLHELMPHILNLISDDSLYLESIINQSFEVIRGLKEFGAVEFSTVKTVLGDTGYVANREALRHFNLLDDPLSQTPPNTDPPKEEQLSILEVA